MTRSKKGLLILWVSRTTYNLITQGEKDLLVRSECWGPCWLRAGDVVEIRAVLKNGKIEKLLRRIRTVRRYEQMMQIVNNEDLSRLAHGSKVQTLSYLARIFCKDQEEGAAVVFELDPMPTDTDK